MRKVLAVGHSYVVRLNRQSILRAAELGGFDLTIAAPDFFHGDLRPLALEPDPNSRVPLVPLRNRLSSRIHLFHYRGLRRLFREGKFDLVFGWEEPYVASGYQLARAAQAHGARFAFLTCQNLIKRYPPPFSFFENQVLRKSAGWAAIGHSVQRAMLEKGYPREHARVIPLGVDTRHFQPLPPAEKRAAQRALGFAASEGPVVGFVGRLVEDKGLPLLMAALEEVKPPWSLLALGSGPMKDALEEWGQRKFPGRVKVMLATHDEMPRYLNAIDVLAAPSQTRRHWKEQFGRMIVEAFACKVAVAGSTSGEIPAVIDKAGMVLPENDIRAWAAGLNELIHDEKRRQHFAEAGYQRCLSTYSTDQVGQSLADFFYELMDAPVAAR